MGKLEFVEGVGTCWTPDTVRYECRDIGYGVETGEVMLPALGAADWTGKRAYRTVEGETVFLFNDELRPMTWRDAMGALSHLATEPAEVTIRRIRGG